MKPSPYGPFNYVPLPQRPKLVVADAELTQSADFDCPITDL